MGTADLLIAEIKTSCPCMMGFAFSPDSRYLGVTTCMLMPFELWGTQSGKRDKVFFQRAMGFGFVGSGKRIVISEHDNINLWQLDNPGTPILKYTPPPGVPVPNCVIPSPDSRHFAITGAFTNDQLALYAVDRPEPLKIFIYEDLGGGCAFSPGGKYLAFTTERGKIAVADVRKPCDQKIISADTFGDFCFSPDSGQFLVKPTNSPIQVYKTGSFKLLRTIAGTENYYSLLISPDGEWAVSDAPQDGDGKVRLWNLENPSLYRVLEGSAGRLNFLPQDQTLAFSPDGRCLALDVMEGQITIYDIKEKEEVATLESNGGGITLVKFSPDGNFLASADDRTIYLWRAAWKK